MLLIARSGSRIAFSSRMGLDFSVGDRTDRANSDEKQPDKKQTEDDAGERAAKTVKKPDTGGSMLSGSFEKKRAQACDHAIDHDRKKGAANHRHDEVRPFQKRT